MRKLTFGMNLSVDGYIAAPGDDLGWSAPSDELTRPNVELITAPISRFSDNGLETGDGVHHRADAIIHATGFRAPEFLVPVTVRGRNGLMLHEHWSSGASAFLGVAVPGFPNGSSSPDRTPSTRQVATR
ncbi:hypothetical protein ACFZC5_17955 [Nocardia gamkensis]|uniref:hypothetical protein n=1 Tax=Nocardia gamkensis TaxID=352869 RepID=UPI0036E9B4D9